MVKHQSHGERVKAAILTTGLALWRENAGSVSARRIAKRLNITHAAVLYHYGTAAAMHDAIACEAVRIGDAAIVPMLIAAKHPAADSLSATDRRRFLAGC